MKAIRNLRMLLLGMLFCFSANAQYRIADLPANLKEGADMVIRSSEMDIQVKSKNSVQIKTKYAYSILNSSADHYAEFIAHYDKLNKVENIEGTLYDAEGNKIRSIKKGELKDYSATSEANLADDDRVKYHNFNHKLYPYTVEYEMTREQQGLFHLPMWIPVINTKVSVQSSMMKVTADAGYEVRFKPLNYAGVPKITELKKQKEYTWSLNNFPAIKEEPYAPGWIDIIPVVMLAPSAFEMQRYTGEMSNWTNFGLFMSELNNGRDVLPAAIKQQVQQVAAGANTKREKVESIYRFMQKNTRYISIQLGIGGWQTHDANFVGSYGYGDCKALTNYMHAMLKEVGITSYPALIRGGRNEWNIVSDFSSNQFNHVILCVPDNKDSIWLECTSQTESPGYLGSFTGNRKALLITPDGGVLVNTPTYDEKDNIKVRNITASINEEGLLQANVNTRYYALQQDKLNDYLVNYSKDQLADYMRTKFNFSYNIDQFEHKIIAGTNPGIQETVSFKSNHYASVSGKRLFINPNIVSVSSFKLRDAESRKYDFEMDMPFTDYDTVRINIPKGFKPESMPAEVDIHFSNADFKSKVKFENDQVIYTRYFSQRHARIPAAKAKELADFFDKIYKADHAKMVFVKNDAGQ